MHNINNVSLIGLGAIGSVYGQKLHNCAHCNLTVIADSERVSRYREQFFQVNGVNVPFRLSDPEDKAEPADLLLVTVKHHHLPEALDTMKKHVGHDTIILSLMNGITSEEIIGERYGMEKMLWGVCVGIDAVRNGNETRYSSMGHVFFGEKENLAPSSRVEQVKELFEAARIPYQVPEDMMRILWWKFMANVGLNQPSALLGAPYGVFQQLTEAKELMENLLEEVIHLANAAKINLSEDDIPEFHRIIANFAPDGKTSMLQDMEAKRKTEVEMLAGTVVALGQKLGVETPLNQMLYDMIRTREKMNGLD